MSPFKQHWATLGHYWAVCSANINSFPEQINAIQTYLLKFIYLQSIPVTPNACDTEPISTVRLSGKHRPQTVTHPISNHLIETWSRVEPTTSRS